MRKLRTLFYLFLEHGATRFFDALTTIVLIRTLEVAALGAFVVYQSWVGIVLLFFPAFENVLYREFGKHKNEGTLQREISIFAQFNWFKTFIALVLVFILAQKQFEGLSYWQRVAALTLAFALPLAQALYGIFREPLRFELRSKLVLALGSVQRASVLAFFLALNAAHINSIVSLAIGALIIFILFGAIWKLSFFHHFKFKQSPKKTIAHAWARISKVFWESVLWMHLSGAILSAVQTLDVYFLSHYREPLAQVAVYSIALKAANFFQLATLPVTQAFGIYLGRRASQHQTSVDHAHERRMVWGAALATAVIGCAVYFIAEYFSYPLLEFLAKNRFSHGDLLRAQAYFKWMVLGVCILAVGYLPGTYQTSRGNVRGLVVWVLVPWMLFSAVFYARSAHLGGSLLAAKANVAVSLVFALGQLLYFVFDDSRGVQKK